MFLVKDFEIDHRRNFILTRIITRQFGKILCHWREGVRRALLRANMAQVSPTQVTLTGNLGVVSTPAAMTIIEWTQTCRRTSTVKNLKVVIIYFVNKNDLLNFCTTTGCVLPKFYFVVCSYFSVIDRLRIFWYKPTLFLG